MELYAIKYGESQFPMKNIYYDKLNSNEKVDFLWLFYVAIYQGKVLLFDTGFRNKYEYKKWGVEFKPYETELASIIGGLDQVDVVFITHSHFDHIGNLDLCKKAITIISQDECEIAKRNGAREISKRLELDRIITVEKEYWFENKFLFQVIGGHSKGSAVISFTENLNHYVITGDECYVCDNLLETRPVGVYSDLEKNREFLVRGLQQGWIPLPMHDTRIFEIYPKVWENIVRLI